MFRIEKKMSGVCLITIRFTFTRGTGVVTFLTGWGNFSPTPLLEGQSFSRDPTYFDLGSLKIGTWALRLIESS